MSLIDHDHGVSGERPVELHFLQEDSVRHDLYASRSVGSIVEAHLVCTVRFIITNLFFNEFTDREGSDTPWLRYADDSLPVIPRFAEYEGNLGCLSRPCRAFDYYRLVLLQGLQYLIFVSIYRKIPELHQASAPSFMSASSSRIISLVLRFFISHPVSVKVSMYGILLVSA